MTESVATLTDAEINRRLAIFCGWKQYVRNGDGHRAGEWKRERGAHWCGECGEGEGMEPGDYLHDGEAFGELLDALDARSIEWIVRNHPKIVTVGGHSYSWDAYAIHAPDNVRRALALATLAEVGDA